MAKVVEEMTATSFIDTFVNDVSEAVGTDPATGGVPITIIQELIALFLSFLGNCPVPPVPAHINGNSNLKTIRMMKALIMVGHGPRTEQGAKLLPAMQAASAKISDPDAETFIAMARN